MWDLWHSQSRDQTCTPCIGRRNLNHWTTREVPSAGFEFWKTIPASHIPVLFPRFSPHTVGGREFSFPAITWYSESTLCCMSRRYWTSLTNFCLSFASCNMILNPRPAYRRWINVLWYNPLLLCHLGTSLSIIAFILLLISSPLLEGHRCSFQTQRTLCLGVDALTALLFQT